MIDKDYAFNVSGCDDRTFLVLNLDDDQAQTIRTFTERVTRRSAYGCQPIITMREASEGEIAEDTELEAVTVEREKETPA